MQRQCSAPGADRGVRAETRVCVVTLNLRGFSGVCLREPARDVCEGPFGGSGFRQQEKVLTS